MVHIPVLKKEVIKYLDPRPGENFIDGTCGSAGHSSEILKLIGPGGRILCLDLDKGAIEYLRKKFDREREENRIILINDNFANLEKIVRDNNFSPVNGILLDLGMSSDQLERSGRGFSFLKDELLDMRFSVHGDLTAETIVNKWPETEIEKILKDYGQELFARGIACQIAKSRKLKQIKTTEELVKIIALGIPRRYQYGRTNFATRTFQALRIAVNDELGSLNKFLPQAFNILITGGRLAVISFHSLEDRIVKFFFRAEAQKGRIEILTKKPIAPSFEEITLNSRSRSAKLRAIKKL